MQDKCPTHSLYCSSASLNILIHNNKKYFFKLFTVVFEFFIQNKIPKHS